MLNTPQQPQRVHMRMCTRIHGNTHMFAYTHTHAAIHLHVAKYVYTSTSRFSSPRGSSPGVYTHTHTRTHTHTHTHTCACIHIHNTCARILSPASSPRRAEADPARPFGATPLASSPRLCTDRCHKQQKCEKMSKISKILRNNEEKQVGWHSFCESRRYCTLSARGDATCGLPGDAAQGTRRLRCPS